MGTINLKESELRAYIREAVDRTMAELKEEAQQCLNFIVNSIEDLLENYVDLSNAEWGGVWKNEMPGRHWATYAIKLMWSKEDEFAPIPPTVDQDLQGIAQEIEGNYGVKVRYIGLSRDNTRVNIDVVMDPYVWRYVKYEEIPNMRAN